MIIGASSFAGTFPELRTEVGSIELYIPKLDVYEGTRLVKSRIRSSRIFFPHTRYPVQYMPRILATRLIIRLS